MAGESAHQFSPGRSAISKSVITVNVIIVVLVVIIVVLTTVKVVQWSTGLNTCIGCKFASVDWESKCTHTDVCRACPQCMRTSNVTCETLSPSSPLPASCASLMPPLAPSPPPPVPLKAIGVSGGVGDAMRDKLSALASAAPQSPLAQWATVVGLLLLAVMLMGIGIVKCYRGMGRGRSFV